MMNTGKKLTKEEVTEIQNKYPFWFIDSPPLLVKSYKNGRRRMYVNIGQEMFIIKQDSKENDEWYKVLNGSNK
jgi:uncharacterized protein Veg